MCSAFIVSVCISSKWFDFTNFMFLFSTVISSVWYHSSYHVQEKFWKGLAAKTLISAVTYPLSAVKTLIQVRRILGLSTRFVSKEGDLDERTKS